MFVVFLYTPKTLSHAVYVSVCNVYVKNEKLFFSFRVFKDDVFDALSMVGESSRTTDMEKLKISEYVIKNFTIKINKKNKKLNREKLSFEGSDYTETINLVFSINLVGGINSLYIKNTILFNHIEEQMNVVGVSLGGYKKTTTYKRTLPERVLKIKWK